MSAAGAPSTKLTPDNLPHELLTAVLEHLPDYGMDVPRLLRVNSAFYLAAKPLLFRRVRLVPSRHDPTSLVIAGPNHPLGDRDVGTSFGCLATPRPIFRNVWLTWTQTLEVASHPSGSCDAFVSQLPHLPRLKVLNCCLSPWHGYGFFSNEQCAFCTLPWHQPGELRSRLEIHLTEHDFVARPAPRPPPRRCIAKRTS